MFICMPTLIRQLLYCTTVFFKVLYYKIYILFIFNVHIICVASIILQYYITDGDSGASRLALWIHEKTDLMNMLSGWNSFTYKGLSEKKVYILYF